MCFKCYTFVIINVFGAAIFRIHLIHADIRSCVKENTSLCNHVCGGQSKLYVQM